MFGVTERKRKQVVDNFFSLKKKESATETEMDIMISSGMRIETNIEHSELNLASYE